MRRAIVFALLTLSAFAAHAQTAQELGNYTYDPSGNVKSIGPDDEGLTNLFDYDSAGRLIRFVRKDESSGATVITETYEYDAYGNLVKQTTNGVAANYPAAATTNRLTGATYDAVGNMTSRGSESYTYDPIGTLTQRSGSWGNAFYIYTADDERVAVGGPDGTFRYMARDLDGKVLREWSSQSWSAAWTWVEDYVYRESALVAGSRPTSQGGDRHFHLDHLGTPRLITNSSTTIYAEHAYYPFGREITSPTQEMDNFGHDTPEPMKFTGHERDFAGSYTGTSLDYMHARYNDPQAGRFLSVDPVLGDPAIPQSWNRYTYVRNSPLVFRDPTGELVDLSALTDDERNRLIAGLNEFTGNTYDFDPKTKYLVLVSVGQNSSATATAYVNTLISTGNYSVARTTVPGKSWYNASANRIELEFNAFDGAIYNGVDSRTFNLGSTAIHEWTHQTTGFFDSPDGKAQTTAPGDFSWTGPVVDAVNAMRRERGLPTRAAYNVEEVRPAGFKGLFGIGQKRSGMRFFDPKTGKTRTVIRNVP